MTDMPNYPGHEDCPNCGATPGWCHCEDEQTYTVDQITEEDIDKGIEELRAETEFLNKHRL